MALLSLPGPSGDEGAVAEWLQEEISSALPEVALLRSGENLLAARGEPTLAIFAHTDTTGFTLGYHDTLIPIGNPEPRDQDALRSVPASPDGGAARGRLRIQSTREKYRLERADEAGSRPGTRWVYRRSPRREADWIIAPYLDNRAGVWCALRALERSQNIAIAFTTGEEQHGHGARVCAELLHARHGLTQAVVADITWHAQEVRCGDGPVISLRDAYCPRQAYLDRVLSLVDESGIPYQQEIQSSGSSDGGHLLSSSTPMDWVFVGAPEHDPHTSAERVALADLERLTDLLVYLADRL